MRPLALELAFDAASDARLHRVWSALATIRGGTSTGELGIAPHLTLALFRVDEPAGDLVAVAMALAQRIAPFRVDLATLDHFATGEGVIFLRPAPSAALAEAHAALHGLLADDAARVDPYYRPGVWQPHCTVALDVPAPRLAEALALVHAADVTGAVEVTRLQLVRYRPATAVGTWTLRGRARRS